jgi:hypothetical protein
LSHGFIAITLCTSLVYDMCIIFHLRHVEHLVKYVNGKQSNEISFRALMWLGTVVIFVLRTTYNNACVVILLILLLILLLLLSDIFLSFTTHVIVLVAVLKYKADVLNERFCVTVL